MVFKSTRQRKFVMAKIKNLRNINTQIIIVPKNRYAHRFGNKVIIVGKDVKITSDGIKKIRLSRPVNKKIIRKDLKY